MYLRTPTQTLFNITLYLGAATKFTNNFYCLNSICLLNFAKNNNNRYQ